MTFPEFPAEIIDRIKDYNPFQLACDAECHGPDGNATSGALLLTTVRDGVRELLEEADDDWREAFASDESHANYSGELAQIADDAPDTYTPTMWAEFVELGAFNEDPTELGFEGEDMDRGARICLYLIADRLAHALIDEVHQEFTEHLAELEDADA